MSIYIKVFLKSQIKDASQDVLSKNDISQIVTTNMEELITETKDDDSERRLEYTEMKKRESFRREFIGNLAHELKTPFFTVQGYILTLLEGKVKDRKLIQKYLEKASNATDRLGFIIQDVDLITQFETGITNLKIERFDLCELIRDLVDSFEIKMKQRGSEITYDFGNDKSIFVNADSLRISQVM